LPGFIGSSSLITSELFGNGRPSSPNNTPEPFHGPRVPVTPIRDNVEAVHELLTRELGVRHIETVMEYFSTNISQPFKRLAAAPLSAAD
jgi:homoserine O-acetyltransferase/O-succinyltransferase